MCLSILNIDEILIWRVINIQDEEEEEEEEEEEDNEFDMLHIRCLNIYTPASVTKTHNVTPKLWYSPIPTYDNAEMY